jgi:hypothetical protein
MKSKAIDIFGDWLKEVIKAKSLATIDDLQKLIEAERTYNDVREILRVALKAKFPSATEYGPYVIDFTTTEVIYETNGPKYFKSAYVIADDKKVTFGDPSEVMQRTVYEPVSESGQIKLQFEKTGAELLTESDRIMGGIIPLFEKKASKDGVIPIKIIEPGWGASGYYPEDVLKRDAGIYKEGTKMYWDHPTVSEQKERPERSLNDLAGVLVSNGMFMETGPEGPGVYAQAKVFGDYAPKIEELAPYIGVSHVAWGKAKVGEIDGKKGKIVESLKIAESVDFVTTEGAGGKIISLFESARDHSNYNSKNTDMSEIKKEDFDALKESAKALETENQRMRESIVLRDARDMVAAELKGAKLPDITKTRLLESVSSKPVLDDKGNMDKVKFTEAIKKAIADEVAYLTKLTDSGKIKGMGDSQPLDGEDTNDKTKLTESLKESFGRMGLSDNMAKIAANGRA